MSGGHYDYAYSKIAQFAEDLELSTGRFFEDGTENFAPALSPSRQKFKAVLELVAEASKAIEWADSGDSNELEAEVAMNKVFDFLKEGQ